MSPACTVLCVDDEPNVLSSLQRVLHRGGLRVLTAPGGSAAIEVMERERVDVLLSDMRMPGMDGVHLLGVANERWPTTMRLLLTGHSDQADTVRAINGGKIFGYLSKPWDNDQLLATIHRAAEFGHLQREKERLQALTQWQNDELRELNGELEARVERRTAQLAEANSKLRRSYMTSIKVFAQLIEQRSGQLVGHGRRVAEFSRRIALAMGCNDETVHHVFVAGLLHDIGLIGMPDSVLQKPTSQHDADQQSLYRMHSTLGEHALMALDDLQPVAALIRSHHERFDGTGFPDRLAGEHIALGARILAVADSYDELLCEPGSGPAQRQQDAVLRMMRRRRGAQYDPKVLDAFFKLLAAPEPGRPATTRTVSWTDLHPGMTLATDLISPRGTMMLAADLVLTKDVIDRLSDYAVRQGWAAQLTIKVVPNAAA